MLVKEYLWCPAYAWLSWNGPPLRAPPHVEVEYTLSPLEASLLAEALGHVGHLVAEARLYSPRLRVYGRVDYLVEPGRGGAGAVLEVKARGAWGGGGHQEAQAALYAIMAEDQYRRPFEAYIVSQLEVRRVPRAARAAALRALRGLRRALAEPVPPRPGHGGSQCRSCAYRRVCPWARLPSTL
ncbi:MAG: PD-(D/E)XK nuclease family protein [Desulfurococcales archaeon]|nr:PD-(D/E)XK nuclease family protein [Desulfurococcales archaeon]